MSVADHDVGHFFRFDAREAYSFVRTNEICDWKILGPFFAMETAVKKKVVPASPHQPNHKGNFHLLALWSASDKFAHGKPG